MATKRSSAVEQEQVHRAESRVLVPAQHDVAITQGAVIPAAVGVDIGCGMIAVRTLLKRSDIATSAAVRGGIERRIPMSAGKNNAKVTATAAERIHILEVRGPKRERSSAWTT